jgi:hypothetical protein
LETIARSLTAVAITAWGLIFFASLFSIGLLLSDLNTWLPFVARYWLAAAGLSAASTYAVGRLLAEHYSLVLRVLEDNEPRLLLRCPEPKAYDSVAKMAQVVAGFEQLSSLWLFSAASLGLFNIYSIVYTYFLVKLGNRAIEEITEKRACYTAPRVALVSALLVASLGLLSVVPGYFVNKLLANSYNVVAMYMSERNASVQVAG